MADGDDAPTNTTGRAVFVRDASGEMITVLPGQRMPEKVQAASAEAQEIVAHAEEVVEEKRLAARTDEDIAYEAYLAGRCGKRGNVWIADAGIASSDRAGMMDSQSARDAEERADSGQRYRPAAAHDRGRAFKSQKGASSNASFGGVSLEAARAGAASMDAALAKARAASDDEDDDGELSMNAVQLANRSMEMYNTPVSNMPQLDPMGNDLRLPLIERKTRKFLECFAEDAQISALDGPVVLKDFEALRKRYGTVFRESGATLKGEVRKRWYFEAARADDDDDDDASGDSWCVDFERHTSLVTPRPGLSLDGSMGCLPPRTQDLVVLYHASGGEIANVWIAPDKADLGGTGSREAIEASEAFGAFRAKVERLSGGATLDAHFNDYLEDQ